MLGLAFIIVMALTFFVPFYVAYRFGKRGLTDGKSQLWKRTTLWMLLFTTLLSLDTILGLPYAWSWCALNAGLHHKQSTTPDAVYINFDHPIVTEASKRWQVIGKPEGITLNIEERDLHRLVAKNKMTLELAEFGTINRYEPLDEEAEKCIPTAEYSGHMDKYVQTHYSGSKKAGCKLTVQQNPSNTIDKNEKIQEVLCIIVEPPENNKFVDCIKTTYDVARTARAEIAYDSLSLPFLPKQERMILKEDDKELAAYSWMHHANRSWLPWAEWPLISIFPEKCVCRLEPSTPVFWLLLNPVKK